MIARRLAYRFLALLAAAALAAALPAVTAAQDEGEETETAQTQTVGDEGTGDDAQEREGDDALVALGVLFFGALALGGTLLYMDRWRQSSAELVKETLSATGELPSGYEMLAAATGFATEEGVRGREAKPIEFKIRGPARLYVGRGARFRAFLDDEPVQAEWSVEPGDAGAAEPVEGKRTTVTATRVGSLKVRASAVGMTAEAEVSAVAVPRRGGRGRIPLVGAGYGGITISIIALTLAAAATVYGKLDGAALVAFAGAIVGYFFVEARGEQAGASGNARATAAGGEGGAAGEGGTGEEGA